MTQRSRRGFLGTMGLAVAGGYAGCTGHHEPTDTERTPNDQPRRVTDTEDPVQWRVTHDAKLAQPPALADGTVVVGWGSPDHPENGALSKVSSNSRAIEWHQEIRHPPFQPPVIHEGNVYLLTGLDAGHVGGDQQLRQFGPGGTERWQTEPLSRLTDLYAIADGSAFLGTEASVLPAAEEWPLYAISLSDGSWDWKNETASSKRGEFHGTALLVEFSMAGLASVDASSGTERWRVDGQPLRDARGQFALANETVFVGRGSTLAGVDLLDGQDDWTLSLDKDAGLPKGATRNGELLVVTTHGGTMYGIDTNDGTERWHGHIDTADSGAIIRSQVLAAEESVVVGTQQGTVIGFDTETGDRRWRVHANGTIRDLHGAGEQIVVVTNAADGETNIVAHDAENGTEQWRYEAGEVRGVVADGQDVYATTDDSLVALGNP